MKKNDAYRVFKNFLFSGTLLASSALCSLPLFAQQTNLGNITGSSGNIGVQDLANGTGTNFNINGGRGYINWNDFNIQNGQTGNFNFNGGNGVVLNRVDGATPTAINGLLQSNGSVYVINPNGLTIGQGGVVNAKGFVGTTFSLSEQNAIDFVNGGNTLNFTAGKNGSVVTNNGVIAIIDSNGNPVEGDITLMGSQVTNTGELRALKGNVNLLAGAGATVVHNAPNHPLITVTGMSSYMGGTGIDQRGFIQANAARLETVNGNVYALAINNAGTIRANRMETTAAGRIVLKADGGTINNSGNLLAESAANGTAGTVKVSAKTVNIENATVTAMGTKSGDNGITVAGTGDVNIKSSVLATTDADININAGGNANFGISASADADHRSTMVNAYDTGNVNVTGANVSLLADRANAYISIGSNHGKTNVTTTVGDLTLKSVNGGYAQVGYHFRDTDDRIYDMNRNDDSLFSGFDFNDRSHMERLAALYIPTGDIDVKVKNDLIIQASYSPSNPESVGYTPAAHIGHAYLAKDLGVGASITKWVQIPGTNNYMTTTSRLSGNTAVTVGRDVHITSDGASIARVGHNVRNFVYIWNENPLKDAVNEVRGNIDLKAGRDIRITANNGGTSGVGHVGDEFVQANLDLNGNYAADIYSTTAGRHTILTSNGSRQLNSGETWHSIAQIGTNLMGEAASFWSEYDFKQILSGPVEANIISLSGANVILDGTNGGTSVIGHENNSRFNILNDLPARYAYFGNIVVGYSFNRYKELDTKDLRHAMDPVMLAYYNQLKAYFTGPEEGYLSVDGNSRIGREYDIPLPQHKENPNYVGIFGFRLMRDGKTDAIRLANGAQLGTGKIDTSLNPAQYDNSQGATINFRYNIGPYPGDGVNTQYDPIEYYGYTYADYQAKDDSVFDFLAFISYMDKNKGESTLKIFYPSVVGKDDYTPPRRERWEEPRYPWFPAWYEPCCCVPCCQVVCCDPCQSACDPCQEIKTTCDSYVPNEESTDESVEEQPSSGRYPTPTLAPPQRAAESSELPVPGTSDTEK